MDAATIVVLVLSACVIALLAWFEANSRRNEKMRESKSSLSQSDFEMLAKKNQSEVVTHSQSKKAA